MRRDSVRALPAPSRSMAAEEAVLGCLLLDARAASRAPGLISAEHFASPAHRAIAAAIVWLASRGRPADTVSVANHLGTQLELAGGLAYLSKLARETPTAANVDAYARVVRSHAQLRALAALGTEIERQVAEAHGDDAERLIADVIQRLITLQADARRGPGLVPIEKLMRELVDDLDRRQRERIGLNIGLADFDALTGGLEPGDLVVFAARPGMGKTSLLVTIAATVARTVPVAVFSAEMPALQLMRRALALVGHIPQNRLRRAATLTDTDWAAIAPAASEVSAMHLAIDDTPLPRLTHIRAESFAVKARQGLGLVLIDFVQLVKGSGANRYEELRDVAYGLKGLAKELGVPIIVLAQLNRGVESRERKRPNLSDLRDSGAIEEAADLVGLLYSEAYYERSFPMPYVLECQVAKNRNGERGQCLWRFSGERSAVEVLDMGAATQYRRMLAEQQRRDVGDVDL